MADFGERLKDFNFKEETVDLEEIFPDLDRPAALHLFPRSLYGPQTSRHDPHAMIIDMISYMLKDGYQRVLNSYGFHDPKFKTFDGHCHQMTPELGLALKAAGFEHVAYLEGYRVNPDTGEKIDPREEQSDMREEFCSINRIPYCCLEVGIKGEMFYISGKHVRRPDRSAPAQALLTPACYRDMVGVLPHQFDKTKSGIYLAQLTDRPWIKDGKPFVWMKQKVTEDGTPDEPMEYFRTFAHMTLTF